MLGSQALETPQLGFRALNEPDLAWLLQPSPEPVEPDLALHQPGTFCWTWPGSAPKPPKPSPEPSPEPCWTWPGSAPKPPSHLRNLLRNPLNLTWLCAKASWNDFGEFFHFLAKSFLGNQRPSKTFKPWHDFTSFANGEGEIPQELGRTACSTSTQEHLIVKNLQVLLRVQRASCLIFDFLWGIISAQLLMPSPSNDRSLQSGCGLRLHLPDLPVSRKARQTFSGTLLNLTWLSSIEPDLALHQSLPRPSPEPSPKPCETWAGSAPKPPKPSREPSSEPCWTWFGSAPKSPGTFSGFAPKQTFSGTFSGTLLNLTWLCTKASQPSPEPSPELLNLTWLCTKASQPSPEASPGSPEPSPETCWTWPGSAPKPPSLLRNLLRNCWTWPGSAPKPPSLLRNLLRNPVEPDLALHQSLPDFLRNLRNLLRNLVEPDPVPAPVHTGAFLGWRPH